MTTREKIEAAFARAEAEFAEAVAKLANASALSAGSAENLSTVFSGLSNGKCDVATLESELDKARAKCLAARNALIRLNLAEGKSTAYRSESRNAEMIAGQCVSLHSAQSGDDSESVDDSEQILQAEETPAVPQPRARKEHRRLIGHLFASQAGSRGTPPKRLLAWQSMQLLALVLAYLQYYFIDANLQIALLPSATLLLQG